MAPTMPTVHKRSRTLLKTLLWVLLVQFVLFNISAAIYAHKLSYFFKDAPDWEIANEKNFLVKTWKLFKGPSFNKNPREAKPPFAYDSLNFKTAGGLNITAWESRLDSAKGTVCLFHGLTSNKAYYLDEAVFFINEGYNVLMLDFRGHGTSEGQKSTLGYREAEEIKAAVDYLQKKGERNIYLFGGSMGAVAVARAAAVYDLKLSGIILEMPFDRLLDHIKARGRTFGFPPKAFGVPVTFWMGLHRNIPAFSHNTSDYAKKISVPVLIQWGSRDHLVLPEETTRIYESFRSRKELVVYDGAVHSSLMRQDPGKWMKEVREFLNRKM